MTRNPTSRSRPPGGDNRGKIQALGVVALVVGLLVGALLAAFLLPIGVDAIVDDKSSTFTQNESETVGVTASLNATLTNVDDTSGAIDVELNDADANETATLTGISEGANATATINGEEVTVNNDGASDNTTATVTYEYPAEYGWSSGAKALWGILDVILVLGMFLMFIAVALGTSDRV